MISTQALAGDVADPAALRDVLRTYASRVAALAAPRGPGAPPPGDARGDARFRRVELAWRGRRASAAAVAVAVASRPAGRRWGAEAAECAVHDGADRVARLVGGRGRPVVVEGAVGAPPPSSLSRAARRRRAGGEARVARFDDADDDDGGDDARAALRGAPPLSSREREAATRYRVDVHRAELDLDCAALEALARDVAAAVAGGGAAGAPRPDAPTVYAVRVDEVAASVRAAPGAAVAALDVAGVDVATDGRGATFRVEDATLDVDGFRLLRKRPPPAGNLGEAVRVPDARREVAVVDEPLVVGEAAAAAATVAVRGAILAPRRAAADAVAATVAALRRAAAASPGGPAAPAPEAYRAYVACHDARVDYENGDLGLRGAATVGFARVAATAVSASVDAGGAVKDVALFVADRGRGDDLSRWARLATLDRCELRGARDAGGRVAVDVAGGALRAYACSDGLQALLDLAAACGAEFAAGDDEGDGGDDSSAGSLGGQLIGGDDDDDDDDASSSASSDGRRRDLFMSAMGESRMFLSALGESQIAGDPVELGDLAGASRRNLEASVEYGSEDAASELSDGGSSDGDGDDADDGARSSWYGGRAPELREDHVPVPARGGEGLASVSDETLRVDVRDLALQVRLFAGADFAGGRAPSTAPPRRPGALLATLLEDDGDDEAAPAASTSARNVDDLVELKAVGASFSASVARSGGARYDGGLGDVTVVESISRGDRKLRPAVRHWRSDGRHPRETGAAAVRLLAERDGADLRVKLRALPLRCQLDAECVRFLDAFFGGLEVGGRADDADDRGALLVPSARAAPGAGCGAVTVDVAPLALKLDYTPRGPDAAGLKRGELGELLQCFALERVAVATRRCRVVAATPAEAWDALRSTWAAELGGDQLHAFVAGASAVRPVAEVGRALRDVRGDVARARDGAKLRALRGSAGRAGAVVACESARGARRLVARLSFALDEAADVLDADAARRAAFAAPGSPARRRDREALRGLDAAARGDRRGRLEDARDAVARGVAGARDACAAAMRRPSPGAVAKAAPVALLRLLAGKSRGVAILLVGLEAEIDADDDAALARGPR